MNDSSIEPEGLEVHVDKILYQYGKPGIPPETPHIFIYFLTIRNNSNQTVTLLGRKWVIENSDGTQLVIEGDKIVGETPTLSPGEEFSYNSFHLADQDSEASGSFHGLNSSKRKIHVQIPPFSMIIPGKH
ncbi:MAG: ApaG domain [Opitutaceae bacterium]|nr:ApaG domain [Opitutaceae bacterium]